MPVDRTSVISLLKRSHIFRGIDNARLETVVNYLSPVEIAAGEPVFQQGDDSTTFYFLYSGRLKVSVYSPRTRQTIQIGFLEESDYFGQEVLAEAWPRQVTIEAAADSTILTLSIPDFKTILDEIPSLSPRLQFVLDIYRMMLSERFSWLEPQEYVYYISRRHPYFLLLRMLAPFLFGLITIPATLMFSFAAVLSLTSGLLAAIAVTITLLWMAWEYLDWANDYYLITNRRAVYQERVIIFYDSRQESPMEAVQSTTTSSTLIGRWLGYGNLAIRTFIGTIYFRAVPLPDQVLAIAQEQQLRAQSGQRRSETKYVENLIEKSLGMAPPSPSAPPKSTSNQKPTPVQKFLSEMFRLRYEAGGAVIYRTHWFILMKKLFLPSLVLLALIALLVSSITGLFTLLSVGATAALVLVFGLVAGGWWFYRYMDWHNDLYIISADQVIDVYKKPLGDEQRQAAPVKNILSIEYKRLGIIGLLFNYGTVYIRVGDQQLTFDDVYNPSAVQRELFDRLTSKTYAEKQAAQESERQRMAEYLAAYHRVIQRNRPPQNPPTRGGF